MNDSLRFPDPATFSLRRVSRNWGEIRLPKLGAVKFRWCSAPPGEVRNVTVSRRAGEWFVSVQCEREVAEPLPSELAPVGIDLGVRVFAALSDGTKVEPRDAGRKAARALARAQRKLARKRRGSANRRKAVARVAKLHARVARVRTDFLHKQSTIIAKSHGMTWSARPPGRWTSRASGCGSGRPAVAARRPG